MIGGDRITIRKRSALVQNVLLNYAHNEINDRARYTHTHRLTMFFGSIVIRPFRRAKRFTRSRGCNRLRMIGELSRTL